ncbi:hypothetical protein [Flavobacterium sp.]|uniref:hypothetical protein n=1 Tax=Flavobacterium sp. TaxID=239 RepID=UPI003D6C51CC
MKKIALAIALTLGLALNGTAQEKRSIKKMDSEKMSAEQRNELQLKKMTLELDLTSAQQKEMAAVISEQNSKREAKMAEMKANKEAKKQLTANEKFEMKNKMLDEQIEHKAKMKKILNSSQFEKWEANHKKRNVQNQRMRTHRKQKADKEVSE